MADPRTLRRSPLTDVDMPTSERVRLRELPFLAMVGVRLDPDGEAAMVAARAVGVPLPTSCGDVASTDVRHVLWLGPDEWLVISDEPPAALLAALANPLVGHHAAVVDLSSNRTTLELTGPAARSVLEKGCPTDLHPRVFSPGCAIVTTIARTPVLLWQIGPESYRILPRSSLAAYVSAWLADAIVEFS
ncbi:sarcosine oxidase subunit gamma [Nocardioides baekrokdamisoli]|uniref:Sarcosine oxidase subunit gamma n=1 Tax=Nocardioides baekrokdamisoli TaxID=1804624 RepID=A0A3G9IBV1_9ACTN|nr:sarcosine oxidase subunit gamma family protein [Nocardioides baekrokdamisoli]BBH15812.1 sarcosine oxidase subunit gamma [Nocardioides baekrokdamisoli]